MIIRFLPSVQRARKNEILFPWSSWNLWGCQPCCALLGLRWVWRVSCLVGGFEEYPVLSEGLRSILSCRRVWEVSCLVGGFEKYPVLLEGLKSILSCRRVWRVSKFADTLVCKPSAKLVAAKRISISYFSMTTASWKNGSKWHDLMPIAMRALSLASPIFHHCDITAVNNKRVKYKSQL